MFRSLFASFGGRSTEKSQTGRRSGAAEKEALLFVSPSFEDLHSGSDTPQSGMFRYVPNDLRAYAKYEYSTLENDSEGGVMNKAQRNAMRESALSNCQCYLRCTQRFVLLEQLNDLGCRSDKHWFTVRDVNLKTERLLTLVPRSDNCPLPISSASKKTLAELFLALQHPYIYPILDIDFRVIQEECYIIVVMPFNSKGSLKDLIYKTRCGDDFSEKSKAKGQGLPMQQVQRLSRQILEALAFLSDRGFPPYNHLHSGNVILQNGVSRLSGYECCLLGYTSKVYLSIKKLVRNNKAAVETILFGHLLFEMCAGYEMSTPQPTPKNYEDLEAQYPLVIKILKFIFENPNSVYPTIKELIQQDPFKNIDLRELLSLTVPPILQARLSIQIQQLLENVRKHHKRIKAQRKKRRAICASTQTPADFFPESEWSPDEDDLGNASSCSVTSPTKETPYASLIDIGGSTEEFLTPPCTPTPPLPANYPAHYYNSPLPYHPYPGEGDIRTHQQHQLQQYNPNPPKTYQSQHQQGANAISNLVLSMTSRGSAGGSSSASRKYGRTGDDMSVSSYNTNASRYSKSTVMANHKLTSVPPFISIMGPEERGMGNAVGNQHQSQAYLDQAHGGMGTMDYHRSPYNNNRQYGRHDMDNI